VSKKQALIGFGVSAFFLYLAFRKSDLGQIVSQVKEVDYRLLLIGLPVLILSYLFRALRWRYLLLKTGGRLKVSSVFGATMIGFMFLNLLPFRLGDLARAYVLGRREGLSKSAVFATVVIERLFDGFTLLIILLTSLFFLPLPLRPEVMSWVRAFSYLGVALFALILALVLLISFKRSLIIRLAESLLTPLPQVKDRVVEIIDSFTTGLTTVSSFRLFMIVSFYSLLIWGVHAVYYWVMMFGFLSSEGTNLGLQVGFSGSLFVVGTIALGVMIPAGPAFVGTFELACIMALSALGAAGATAESYAIVAHTFQFLPVVMIGIIYLYVQQFTFKEISAGEEAA